MTKLNIYLYFSLFLIIGILSPSRSNAQVVLYLEVMNDAKPIKYYVGDWVSYKTAEFPDDWQNRQIKKIIAKEKIILFEGKLLKLSDITDIRRSRTWVNAIGYSLQSFGTAWLVYGAIAHYSTSFEFGTDTAIIGGGALISGYLLRKFFKYKKYRIGKKNRIKILDISWPEPRG
ncbi:MAG: hypothetical protein V3V14_13495 [Saprospiraceae bacterium]